MYPLLQFQFSADQLLTNPWRSRFTTVESGVCIINGKVEALIGIILWDIAAKVRYFSGDSRLVIRSARMLTTSKGLPLVAVHATPLE